jgi:hemoglobin-like flavoprotein
VSPEVLDSFDDSLRRCEARPGFLDRFYERFLASSPEVREKFANTNLVRQKKALRESFNHLVLAATDFDRKAPDWHLAGIVALHGPEQLDIRPALYDVWLECLLDAVKEFDPEYGPEVEEAWREVMQFGISYLREGRAPSG